MKAIQLGRCQFLVQKICKKSQTSIFLLQRVEGVNHICRAICDEHDGLALILANSEQPNPLKQEISNFCGRFLLGRIIF
jgi:hypothetical protein